MKKNVFYEARVVGKREQLDENGRDISSPSLFGQYSTYDQAVKSIKDFVNGVHNSQRLREIRKSDRIVIATIVYSDYMDIEV